MRTKSLKMSPETMQDHAELPPEPYAACVARTLVADMFEQHRHCVQRACRTAGACLALANGAFCPAEMDSRQAFVFTGMLLFRDAMEGRILPEDAQ